MELRISTSTLMPIRQSRFNTDSGVRRSILWLRRLGASETGQEQIMSDDVARESANENTIDGAVRGEGGFFLALAAGGIEDSRDSLAFLLQGHETALEVSATGSDKLMV